MKGSWFKVEIPALVVVVLLFGSILGSAGAVAKDDGIEKAKKIAKKIEKDLKETGKYSEKDLEKLILVLAQAHKLALSEKQKKAAKDYALHEIKKKIRLEKLKKNVISKTTTNLEKIISGVTTYKILSSEPVFTFKQIEDDITGTGGYYKFDDSGNPYNINGDNDLYRVDISTVYLDDPDYTNCPIGFTYWVYTMYYYDEDHPNPDLDPLYDAIRQATYGRIEDIETFYVRTIDNLICFDEIWSNDKTFAEPIGQHGIATFPYTSTIYIAVWNHALDVDDNNPSLDKVIKP